MSNLEATTHFTKQIITQEKISLVKEMICKGASDNELELFITNCNRTGLDPFQKQCWAVKRWDASAQKEVMTFQTGVDGFRVIANRSQKYAGQVGPYWCGDDGAWKDVWLSDKPPIAAKVGVLRSDFKEPLWAVAKFSSYAARKKDGSLTPFWFKMPDLMIAKVAECLALRKAFPQDLSGIYAQEEMEQSLNQIDVTPTQEKTIVPKPVYKKEALAEPPPLNTDEPLFSPDEITETNKKVIEQTKTTIPNEALGVYTMKGGKFAGKTLNKIKKEELYRYVADVSAYQKENKNPLPAEVVENINNIKQYLGLM